jgi:hemerythrin-like domain-containing protein
MSTEPHDPPSVVETALVHDVHRRATTLLAIAVAEPSTDPAAVVALRDFVVEVLRHHHESEDADLWPLLVAAEPHLGAPLARLSLEHDRLDTALDELAAAPVPVTGDGEAVRAAGAVRDLVHEHLGHEEPILFPALRAHLGDDAWDAFSARTVSTSPPTAAPLLVALMHAEGTPEAVGLVLDHLPPERRGLVDALREQGDAVLAAVA